MKHALIDELADLLERLLIGQALGTAFLRSARLLLALASSVEASA
jgi:hypothetical protein